MRSRYLVLALIVSVLHQACSSPAPCSASTTLAPSALEQLEANPIPTSTQDSAETSIASGPTHADTPASYPTPEPVELHPSSARAEQGRAYPFSLYTHCGVDFAVDFDGSYWDLAPDAGIPRGDPNPPPGIGNPEQQGTMTLTGPNRARFDYEGGSIPFSRHQGPKVVPGLCQ